MSFTFWHTASAQAASPTMSDYNLLRDNYPQQNNKDNSNLIDQGILTDLKLDCDSAEYSKSRTCLKGQISNVPEVSQGIRNLDDAKALAEGVRAGLCIFGTQALDFLSTPYAVNKSIMSLGPVLDTAVNYYVSTPIDQVAHDAQVAGKA